MAGRIDLTKFTSSWVLRPSLNRNLLSLIQPKHHYYSYTRTRIILVCVKIKVNSSFKGQAHQKWEPWKKKKTAIKYEDQKPEKLRLASPLSFSERIISPFFLPFDLSCILRTIQRRNVQRCERRQIKAWIQTPYLPLEFRQFILHCLRQCVIYGT